MTRITGSSVVASVCPNRLNTARTLRTKRRAGDMEYGADIQLSEQLGHWGPRARLSQEPAGSAFGAVVGCKLYTW